MTRKASDPSMISVTTLRMNALSSTTRTVCRLEGSVTGLQGSHQHPPVVEMKIDAAAIVAADVLRGEGDPRFAQRLAGGEDVALSHVDPPRGKERAEHARAPGDLRRVGAARAELLHLLEEQRHRRGGEFRA